jgi:mono/diheme cytochrome c family protein
MKIKILFCALIAAALLLSTSSSFAQYDNAKNAPQPGVKYVRRNELAKAPAKYQKLPNPMASDSTAPAAGKFLYDQHCYQCHGKTADGTRRGPSLLRDRVQTAPDGAVFWLITNGVVWHGMPVWSKLPEPERWQIVSYIKSLGSPMGGAGTARPQASIMAPR